MLAVLLALELNAVMWALFYPPHQDRSFMRAISDWSRSPTEENRVKLEEAKERFSRDERTYRIECWSVVAGLALVIVLLVWPALRSGKSGIDPPPMIANGQ